MGALSVPPQVSAATSDGAVTFNVTAREGAPGRMLVTLSLGKDILAEGDVEAREEPLLAWLMIQADKQVTVLERKIARRRQLRGY